MSESLKSENRCASDADLLDALAVFAAANSHGAVIEIEEMSPGKYNASAWQNKTDLIFTAEGLPLAEALRAVLALVCEHCQKPDNPRIVEERRELMMPDYKRRLEDWLS